MKKILASEFLPITHLKYNPIGRKHKNIFSVKGIVILFFTFTTLLSSQNIINQNAPDVYKNVYTWQAKENTFPANDSILTILGRWAWGACLAVDADSNYAYIGNGPIFHVLDISDPATPEIIGEYLTEGFIYDIEIRNNIAFVCIGSGLLILDITNPTTPEEISFVEIGGVAISFALEDSFAYVTTFSGVMQVVDISDSNNPYKRGAIAAGGEFAYCVEAKDSIVYIGNPEWPDLEIVDATNPDTLIAVYFDIGGSGLSAFIKDTILFIGVGYYGLQLKIYNIATLTNPDLVGQLQITNPEDIMAITVSDDEQTAYIRTDSGNVYSVDISDLTQPEIKDKYEKQIGIGIGKTGIAFSNNSVFSAHYTGLLTLDASEPDSLRQQSFFPTSGFAEKIQVRDSIAFVASGLAGLWIVDMSNPAKPRSISNVNTAGFTSDLVIEDTLAYIVNSAAYSQQDTSRGLWIIGISDIYNPIVLSHHIGITRHATSYVHPNSIAKSGNLIFITQTGGLMNDSTLEIIDVSNPFNPITKNVFRTSYSPYDVSVSDTVVFLATADGGVRIIDLSNPENPIEISNILNAAFGITFKKPFLYTSTSTFSIINAEDPTNPFVVSSVFTHYGSSSVDLIVSGNYVYWAEGELGMIDISNTEDPMQITTFWGKDWGRGVDTKNNLIFFADQTQGIWILKNDLITGLNENNPNIINDYELYQNYPNPFNPITIISYQLPERSQVILKVFDILGREVATLVNEEKAAGNYEVRFDASNLSSGIYFYSISAGDFHQTKKMILLR